jgi:hypothetical protein
MNNEDTTPRPLRDGSYLLSNNKPLTAFQYRTARRGGYTSTELEKKDYDWYQKFRTIFTCKKGPSVALNKQKQFLEEQGIALPDEFDSYVKYANAITKYILTEEEPKDERFMMIHEKYLEDNRKRNSRKRSEVSDDSDDTSDLKLEIKKVAANIPNITQEDKELFESEFAKKEIRDIQKCRL